MGGCCGVEDREVREAGGEGERRAVVGTEKEVLRREDGVQSAPSCVEVIERGQLDRPDREGRGSNAP